MLHQWAQKFYICLFYCSQGQMAQLPHRYSNFIHASHWTHSIYVCLCLEAGTPYLLWGWELPVYWLMESGWLWFLTSDKELIKNFGLKRLYLCYTPYYSTDRSGCTAIFLALQVNDYVNAGTTSCMSIFEDFLSSKFDLSQFECSTLSFIGHKISQNRDLRVRFPQQQMLS